MARDPVTREALVAQLRDLGVMPGDLLLVHTSFRAVRPIAGGPEGLVLGLLDAVGREGTLAMPGWTSEDDAIFDPALTPCPADLGITAETFRRMPGVERSSHPMAFIAKGPLAAEVVSGDLPLPPHGPASPVGHIHRLDGKILLLGVGQDANTTLHMAESLAGVPYSSRSFLTIERDGQPVRVAVDEPDHCCQRFSLADDWLSAEGRIAIGPVGHGTGRLMRSRDVVEAAVMRLRVDPLVFLHGPEAGCEECDAARGSVGVGGAP
ncbi:aminoglycoside 3-N-acetyltransferase [Devosia enhydra]|uniref:Aminoglycoside N(3)-acetyltransferase n=1 Tax=Devosia enhydra TaxID=665118 RepID=A0A1K2HT39_9HYPH|nr:AAC(3) family N-acetyltransferase [Devosia enhydra]SFZ81206.1 aminoglycoside 3-N-acetyltransferase [Devosia enhydra]